MTTRMEIGTYKSVEYFAIIGNPTDFYVWVKEKGERGSASDWIIGTRAFELYNQFRGLGNKQAFKDLARKVFKQYGGSSNGNQQRAF